MPTQASQMATSTAQLGIPVPLAYGPAHATGNLFIEKEVVDAIFGEGTKIACFLLGEGEWDGIDKLYVRRKEFDFTNVAICHFHPGLDGHVGTGSTGGNQSGDAFLVDAGFDPAITFSRTACLWLKVPPDPGAVSADLEVIGNYRTTKCRIFDAAGNQSDYRYTETPAWWYVDLMVRGYLKQQALLNDPLNASEKALFDWVSIADTVAYQEEVLNAAMSDKRLSGGVAFVQQQSMTQALEQIHTMGRSYARVVNGRLQLRADKPDTIKFYISREHLTADLVQPSGDKTDLGGAANSINGHYLDLEGRLVEIDSHENVGLTRSAGLVTCNCLSDPGKKNGDIITVKGSEAEGATPFDGQFTIGAVLGNTLQWLQAGEDSFGGGGFLIDDFAKFREQNIVLNHEAHQRTKGAAGVGIPFTQKEIGLDLDLGVNTFARVRRHLHFLLTRNLGVDGKTAVIGDEVIPFVYRAPLQWIAKLGLDAVDKNGIPIDSIAPGDHVFLQKDVSDEAQGEYEVIDSEWDMSGWNNAVTQASSNGSYASDTERPSGTASLHLKEVVPEGYSDTLPEDEEDAPPAGVITTPWMTAAVAINEADGAGELDWNAPANVEGPDDDEDVASISIPASPPVAAPAHSKFLKCTGFNFSSLGIPSGASVKGFQVRIRRFANQHFSNGGVLGVNMTDPGRYGNPVPAPSVQFVGGSGPGGALGEPIWAAFGAEFGIVGIAMIASGSYSVPPILVISGGLQHASPSGTVLWDPPVTGSAFVQDEGIRPCKAGVIQATDRSITAFWENGDDRIEIYGAHDDLWGMGPIAGSDVNNAGFGCAFKVKFTESGNGGNIPPVDAGIFGVAMRVFYQ